MKRNVSSLSSYSTYCAVPVKGSTRSNLRISPSWEDEGGLTLRCPPSVAPSKRYAERSQDQVRARIEAQEYCDFIRKVHSQMIIFFLPSAVFAISIVWNGRR